MTGRQVSILALFVPFALVGIVGRMERGARGVAAALACGFTFGVVQFAVSNFINYKLVVTSLPRSPQPRRSSG